ncbi:MAG: ABC transporter ATP-binding protein [Deltaproteobacteria bacterium]|nr:ABC transporter ATP-binding protein [Deltaproteobacteria bacterium]
MSETFITLDHVAKSYPGARDGESLQILKDCDVSIKRGSRIAIIGPSGSGKSTLMSLMAGLDRPSTGRIRVMNQDLGELSESQLGQFRARHLGIVFQQFHLISHLTAEENVALPLRILGATAHEASVSAQRALADVGLEHRIDHVPSRLSGGECQRVAIARAMITKPAGILADEPSGNLDVRTGDQVMGLLFELTKAHGITLILVTHNEELARRCDQRLMLQAGRLEHV